MTKQELIDRIDAGLKDNIETKHIGKKAVSKVLDALGDVAAAELLGGGHVPLPGLGKLKGKPVAARTGRNPKAGAKLDIPAQTKVVFSAGKDLKDALK